MKLLLNLYYLSATTVPSPKRMLSPSKLAKLNKFSTWYKFTTQRLFVLYKLSMCCKLTNQMTFGILKFVFSLDNVMPLIFCQNCSCPVLWHLLKPYLVHVELLKSFSELPCTISRYFMMTLYGCSYCLITAMQYCLLTFDEMSYESIVSIPRLCSTCQIISKVILCNFSKPFQVRVLLLIASNCNLS